NSSEAAVQTTADSVQAPRDQRPQAHTVSSAKAQPETGRTQAQTATPKAPTVTPQTQTAAPKTQAVTPKAQTASSKTQTATPKTQTMTPKAQAAATQTPTVTPQVQAAAAQTPAAAPQAQSTAAQAPVQPAPPQPQPDPVPAAFLLAGKTTDELRAILSGLSRKQEQTSPEQAENDERYRKVVEQALAEKLTAKYDARVRTLNNLSSRQLTELKTQVEKESVLSEEKKKTYIQKINGRLFQEEEKVLAQKVELSRNRSYAEIGRMIEDIEKRSLPEELKQETVRKLKQFRKERAEQEVAQLIEHLPLHLDRKQLAAYLEKINQYDGVDITPYRNQLEQRKDMAEKEEITAMIKRGGKKERNALWNLYEQIQKQDFKEENKAPFLEKIYAKIKKMDEEKIEQLCPSIVTLSYSDALKAYDRISQGMFLPELKVNTLEMIKRRLTRLKTDESVQLMRKLKHDLE
ncbi:MAG: hypothetical protein K2P23_03560, partial [Lachnospiraceae bacterium]|nr:hypothetical protein [Lachnospiraceae bacterium]